MLTKIIQWLVLSSKDPQKISVTVKGAASMLVPIIILVSGITADQANTVVDQIQVAVQNSLFVITAIVTLWGAVRKIIFTFKGENEVIKAQDRGELE